MGTTSGVVAFGMEGRSKCRAREASSASARVCTLWASLFFVVGGLEAFALDLALLLGALLLLALLCFWLVLETVAASVRFS